MKKVALIVAVLGGSIAYLCVLVVKTERLEARVMKLEALVAISAAPAPNGSMSGLEIRVGRLEKHVASLEETFEKKIVRDGLNGKLKDVRDTPPGF